MGAFAAADGTEQLGACGSDGGYAQGTGNRAGADDGVAQADDGVSTNGAVVGADTGVPAAMLLFGSSWQSLAQAGRAWLPRHWPGKVLRPRPANDLHPHRLVLGQ